MLAICHIMDNKGRVNRALKPTLVSMTKIDSEQKWANALHDLINLFYLDVGRDEQGIFYVVRLPNE